MSYQLLLYVKAGPVATITINRPEALLALNPTLEAELHLALDEADADAEVRAIILTGAGRAFSAGYDVGPREEPGQPSRHDPAGRDVADFIQLWWTRDKDGPDKLLHLW